MTRTDPSQDATAAPVVSVIIPVRDRRDMLITCLDALGAQRFDPFEVIVVDDGSTDGSAEAARSHPCGGRPVTVVEAAGRGAVAARIAGVARARADVLAFTDSDCVPDPGWLAALVDAINDGADVVQGRTEPTRPARPLERSVWALRDDGLFATCNVAYTRVAYQKAGGFDVGAAGRLGFRIGAKAQGLGFGEDTLLGWRVRRAGTFRFEERAVVRHHVFPYDRRDLVSRSAQAGAFPALVREVPELRRTLLRRRVLLGTTRVPLYCAVACAAVGWKRAAGVALGVWVGTHWRRVGHDPDLLRRVGMVATSCELDLIEAATLIAGSATTRTLVL